jgi:L-alanine-DL-glutamate epimerase-like enolase superfamily enzyme
MSRNEWDPGPEERLYVRLVAERAGVATSSVSRVLSDHPGVSTRMRRRVRAVVEELGYEPNLLAQSLRRLKWIEQPLVPRDLDGHARLRRAVSTAVGTGEDEWDAENVRPPHRRRGS